MTRQKKIYGFFSFFQPLLIQFYPSFKSDITKLTIGFPSYFVYYLCAVATVVETLILTAINVAFAIEQRDLFSQPVEQQLLLFLSTIFTVVLGVVSFLEVFLMNTAEKVRSYSVEIPNSAKPLKSNDEQVANPIQNL
jgi:hypothetical protein